MKPRVLMTASTYGHIRSFHLPYLNRFQELNWETHVACGGSGNGLPFADCTFDLPFEKSMSSPANFRAVKHLKKLLQEQRYDLVITHTSLAAFFTRLAVMDITPHPPTINMAHGYLFDDNSSLLKRKILLAAEQLTAPQTDLLLTMNQYDFQLAQQYRLGKQIVNIPGVGVDFSVMDESMAASPAQRMDYDFASTDFILLYAAEFSRRKNQAMLIRALPSLPAHVKLLLPGRGALLDDCKQLAEQLGVETRVCFPGFVFPMAPLYRMANCAVSASRSEGLPFNIMEAMYARLPVVASRVKGHTDLLLNNLSGLLFPYDDEAAFAATIQRLLDDPVFAAALGEAAHEAVLPYGQEFVLPQVMEQYLSLVPATHAPAHYPTLR